jgi:hypothetical protein
MNKVKRLTAKLKVLFAEKVFERCLNYLSNILIAKGFNLSIGTRSKENILVKNFVLNDSAKSSVSKWCVVFQGKIYDKDFLDYLMETLSRTRLQIPDIALIVATYEDENFETLKHFCLAHNIVITTVEDVGSLPHPYPQSICQQIESSYTGLKLAQENGFENSIKIRVDQRIDVLISILMISQFFEKYPSEGLETKNRIWGTSYNTYLHRPLALSDMVQFGKTKDLVKYWNRISPSEWHQYTFDLTSRYSNSNWSNFAMPETWLAARYLDHLGITLTSPEEANSIFWENFAGVINSNAVGQEWRKTFSWLSTNYHTVKWFTNIYVAKLLEMRFEDWLVIHFYGKSIREKSSKIILPY